jgi:hypothetical protein
MNNRRQSPRYRLDQPLPAYIGRGRGALVDLSANGARIRHTSAVARGARVRIVFDWKGERFQGIGEVLASRVAGFGAGGTEFESRVRFLPLAPSSSALLQRAVTDLDNGDLRKWVANLQGWSEDDVAPAPAPPSPVNTFVRCRLVNRRWEQRVTRDPSIPPDGFIVAGGTEPSEIRALCRTFEQSDAEGRQLLQRMTGAVLQEAG